MQDQRLSSHSHIKMTFFRPQTQGPRQVLQTEGVSHYYSLISLAITKPPDQKQLWDLKKNGLFNLAEQQYRFPLGSWPLQSQALGHPSMVRYEFYLRQWAINPTRQWVVTLIAFMPLLYQCTMQTGCPCRSKGLQLGSAYPSGSVQYTFQYQEHYLQGRGFSCGEWSSLGFVCPVIW